MLPYIPQKLPLEHLDWARLVPKIGQANYQLARFEETLVASPNPMLLLVPLGKQEAVLSSRIEGTQATLEEVLRYEASRQVESPGKEEDIQEIVNYVNAMSYAWKALGERPLSLNLIREVHRILLEGVRGKRKGRGEFRRVQNWIGGPGVTLDRASYVPPPPERVMEFLDNWEKYIHYDEQDRLVQLAIVHAQFEVIHPFVDGNGRVGRMLIPLFLYEKGLLSSPLFTISAFLESHREAYYQWLFEVSNSQDWEGWIEFFLYAVSEQAARNTDKAQQMLALHRRLGEEVISMISSKYARDALDALFMQPIFSSTTFAQDSGIPKRTALRILDKLKERKILAVVQAASGRQAEVLAFPELIAIVEGD